LNHRKVFVVIVGECVLSNAPLDDFFQLRIRKLNDESALFHDWIFGDVLKYIYLLVPNAKSDEEARIRVHPHLLQTLCL
jgi:hypothetical protein